MNEEAINQFKSQTNNLIGQLSQFLRWCDEKEAQDQVYESKMRLLAQANKDVEKKTSDNIIREQELNKRELKISEDEDRNRLKAEELLLKEGNTTKDKEKLIQDKVQFEKEKTLFEQAKIKEDILINMKRQLQDRKKELDEQEKLLKEREKLNDERAIKLEDREKAIKKREKYLQGLLDS